MDCYMSRLLNYFFEDKFYMKKLLLYVFSLAILLNSCKKESGKQEDHSAGLKITNELNQFKDLKEPEIYRPSAKIGGKTSAVRSAADGSGCSTVLHTQSAEFDKLSVLDPATDIMYVGSLLDGQSIQDGTYKPLFLSDDYVRKPITYSVSIQGSTGVISKTIVPALSNFRTSMQEIINSTIVGQQPANFTFDLLNVRSKKEIEFNVKANLKFGTFFNSLANYNESGVSSNNYYLLKIYQRFFTADIDIPSDGNLFNKPVDFNGIVAPVYISSIDYGRSAYLLIESSFDSTRVYKSLEASFAVWKLGGGTTITKEQKEVMDNIKISGTIIGGSSTDAAKTIDGIQAFRDYVVNSGNLSNDSRGEVIAYKLRNAKNHDIYKTLINGDYYTTDCSSQLVNINSFIARKGGDHYLTSGWVSDPYWNYEGVAFRAFNKQVPGSVPVNVFFSQKGTDHYFSTGWLNEPDWWAPEGVAFYAYKTQIPGTVPIYCHFSTKGIDHYFSTLSNLGSPDYWDRFEGIAFYAFPK